MQIPRRLLTWASLSQSRNHGAWKILKAAALCTHTYIHIVWISLENFPTCWLQSFVAQKEKLQTHCQHFSIHVHKCHPFCSTTPGRQQPKRLLFLSFSARARTDATMGFSPLSLWGHEWEMQAARISHLKNTPCLFVYKNTRRMWSSGKKTQVDARFGFVYWAMLLASDWLEGILSRWPVVKYFECAAIMSWKSALWWGEIDNRWAWGI